MWQEDWFSACRVSMRLVCQAASRPMCVRQALKPISPASNPPTPFPMEDVMDGRWSRPVANGSSPTEQRKISLY